VAARGAGAAAAQDPNDESALGLLKRIAAEKAQLFKLGKVKKADAIDQYTSSSSNLSVPSGWTVTHLQSVCISITDGDHLPPPKAESGVPFLVIGNVRNQVMDFTETRFVPQEYYEALDPIRRPVKGDLLYTLVGSYGIPVVVRDDQPFCVQRHIGIMRPSKFIDFDFLSRAMESKLVFDQATACATGIARKTVPLSGLRRFIVPLPPLAEQRRIVSKVDELMSLCDRLEAARAEREKTRDRLTSASLARLNEPDSVTFRDDGRFMLDALAALTARRDQLKQFRQTILRLAVRGKLVPQDPKDEPAAALLVRTATERARLVKVGKATAADAFPAVDYTEAPFDLPSGWTWARFHEVGIFGRGKSKHRPRNDPALFDKGTHRFVQTGDVARSRGLIETFTGKYNDAGLAQSAMWPAGTLCITIAANIADSGILSFDACFPDSVVGFIPAAEFPNARYFEYFLRTAKADLSAFAPATAQKNINLGILNALLIPLPPLAEQHRIVAKVEELMALCDQLEASLAASDETRSQVLDALFGEALTPGDNAAPSEPIRLAAHV
jgi:type I restriction enzyme, S subunit